MCLMWKSYQDIMQRKFRFRHKAEDFYTISRKNIKQELKGVTPYLDKKWDNAETINDRDIYTKKESLTILEFNT